MAGQPHLPRGHPDVWQKTQPPGTDALAPLQLALFAAPCTLACCCLCQLILSWRTTTLAAYTPGQRTALVLIPPAAALCIRLLGSTLRYRNAGPAMPGDELPGPSIFVFPHRSLLLCAHRFRHRGIGILISRSFDGELIARTVERLGFIAIRGSSSRGGATALRQMAAAYGEGRRCAITTDGPRGPSLIVKPGAAQLAALVEAPWVGAFYALPSRTWILKTWDRFLIPKPFASVTITWPEHAAPHTPQIQAALNQAVALANP